MNLKQRMKHQNKNNSDIINNSGFDFGNAGLGGNIASINNNLIYEKSRRDCQEELVKRKAELEAERITLKRKREHENAHLIDKFKADYDEVMRQILAMIQQSLLQNRQRMLVEITQKRLGQTQEQIYIRLELDELISRIDADLSGLRKTDQYREYIAKVVTSDFDTKKEEIKLAIRKFKLSPVGVCLNEKPYTCLRNDVNKAISVDFGRRDFSPAIELKRQDRQRFPNMHQNRDKLKNNYF